MKKILIFCMIGLFLLVGCKPKSDLPKDVENITSIEVRNTDGRLVEQDVAYQQESSTALYVHDHLVVYAKYSDSTEKDITENANFSVVDLTKLGEQTVTITYYSFSCNYKLLVKANPVKNITIQTEGVKRIYTVGETYSSIGLIVTGTRENGEEEVLASYDVKVTDDRNRSYDIRLPFANSGLYDVRISSGEGYATYQIAVKLNQYSKKDIFNVTEYTHEIPNYSGQHKIESDTILYSSSSVKLSTANGLIRNRDTENKLLNLSYLGTTYSSVLEVSLEENIAFELSYATEIVILASSLANGSMIFTSDEVDKSFYFPTRSIEQNLTLYYLRLDAGKYEFHAIDSPVWIYNMDFGNIEDLPDANIKKLSVDTTYVKTVYEINDPFLYTEIRVVAEYVDNTTEILQNYDWTYRLSFNGVEKTKLDEPGEYVVTIFHKNHYVSFTIIVKESKN